VHKSLLEYIDVVAEETSPTSIILAVAELMRKEAELTNQTAKTSIFVFLDKLQNAGLPIDYTGLKAYYDADPRLSNVIQQFNDREIEFVGQGDEDEAPDTGAPVGDIPPEEKVSKMAKDALAKRESIGEDEYAALDSLTNNLNLSTEEYAMIASNQYEDNDELMAKLMDHFSDAMPYGTAKGRDGDPYEFIFQELDNMGLIKEGEVELDEEPNEGNEFSGKRKEAIDAGKDEFEVDGKMYKVTKEDEEEVDEAAKPDFLDLDKDGNKKESMKKAAKDKEDKKEVKEGTWHIADDMSGLQELIASGPIPAKDALDVVSEYIGDDDLSDAIGELEEKDPNADARDVIRDFLEQGDMDTYEEVQAVEEEDDMAWLRKAAGIGSGARSNHGIREGEEGYQTTPRSLVAREMRKLQDLAKD